MQKAGHDIISVTEGTGILRGMNIANSFNVSGSDAEGNRAGFVTSRDAIRCFGEDSVFRQTKRAIDNTRPGCKLEGRYNVIRRCLVTDQHYNCYKAESRSGSRYALGGRWVHNSCFSSSGPWVLSDDGTGLAAMSDWKFLNNIFYQVAIAPTDHGS